MIVRWGPDLIQIYNDAYAELIGVRHPEALGMTTKECWPDNWETYSPIYEAVFKGEVHAFQDRPAASTRTGIAQVAWFDVTFSPVRGEDRAVEGILMTVAESTPRIQKTLRAEAAAASGERLRSLFAQAPGFIAIFKGPDHVIEFANEAWQRLVGRTGVVGMKVRDVVPEVEGQGFFELMDRVFASGEPFVGSGMLARLARGADGAMEKLYIDLVYQPMPGPDGKIEGIFIEGSEVTERVMAAERQTMLVDELNHRVKNTLSTVLAIAKLASKSANDVKTFNETFTSRIVAMSKTHDLLTARYWAPVKVREVLHIELAPYADAGGQMTLACDDMAVSAPDAVSLSLIIHELLTNAANHGALATTAGRLKIGCARDGEEAVLTWREDAGRPVDASAPEGFGRVLVGRLARGLGGGAEMKLDPSGLRATLRFPLTDEATPAPLPSLAAQHRQDQGAAQDKP
jgi:PAS domain S-box-containing protein